MAIPVSALLKPFAITAAFCVPFSAPAFAANPAVSCIGLLRNVMQNDDRVGKVALNQLIAPHLFALGPVENLDGEITVLDGTPFISHADPQGSLSQDHNWSTKAVVLVYANVADWESFNLPAEGVPSLHDLEGIVESTAAKAGLDTEKPFPFLVRGTFSALKFHIVRGTDSAGHYTPGGDRVPLSDQNTEGVLVGFFSKHHQGVFTHKDSFVHVHYISGSSPRSGHLEELKIDEPTKVQLELPKQP